MPSTSLETESQLFMSRPDTSSHASLNGLYIKAREMNIGHVDEPSWKVAPPGASLEDAAPESAGCAHSDASAHAGASPRAGASPEAHAPSGQKESLHTEPSSGKTAAAEQGASNNTGGSPSTGASIGSKASPNSRTSASPSASPSSEATAHSRQARAHTGRQAAKRDYSLSFEMLHVPDASSCSISFRCFDTPNTLTIHHDENPEHAESVLLAARKLCLELHGLWSFSTPGSDLARINKNAQRVEVDTRTATLIGHMARFNAAEPLFDFTIGPASFLWKYARRVPSEERIEHAMAHVGASTVSVDGTCICKQDPKAKIDVGAAAKGAAADMLASCLREEGVTCAEINLGGNLYLLGPSPSGHAWNVDITVPDGINAQPPQLQVTDASVVTSGSYERFVEIDGKRYQHIVDPRTGWPASTDIVSVSVCGGSSLEADMLATTACIAGSGELESLALRHPGYSFTAILEDGRVLQVPAHNT